MHCLFEDIGVQRGNLERLAAVPTSRLLEASSAALHKITGGDALLLTFPITTVFSPVIDGIALPDYPMSVIAAGSCADVSVMVGTNRHDHFNATRLDSNLAGSTTRGFAVRFSVTALMASSTSTGAPGRECLRQPFWSPFQRILSGAFPRYGWPKPSWPAAESPRICTSLSRCRAHALGVWQR
jgi:hypothetical protein